MCKRLWTTLLACVLAFSCAVIPVRATEQPTDNRDIMRATGQINHKISANTLVSVGNWISMDQGELIQFNCTYVSKSASVDFGYVDSSSAFHYLNCTSGSINQSLTIAKPGEYIIAIRNNAPYDITVTGSIRY